MIRLLHHDPGRAKTDISQFKTDISLGGTRTQGAHGAVGDEHTAEPNVVGRALHAEEMAAIR